MQATGIARPRAIIVHSSDELYGADRIVIHVATALVESGFDVEIWLPSDLEHGPFPLCHRLRELGLPFVHHRLPVLRRAALRPAQLPRLLVDAVRTWRQLRRARPDVVYLGSSACLLAAPLARIVHRTPTIVHIQERWDGRSARVLRWLATSTRSRIAISRYVADSTGLHAPEPVVILNAVDDASERAAAHDEARTGPLTYVVASRWNRWKGHATLLAAWEAAGCPGTLVVLGGPPSVGEGVDVPALAAGLTRPDSVRIVGEVEDVAPFIADADVLVLPSDEPEPFGLVVIEAFSLSRPVIASRAGGPLEIIDDATTGWFFEPCDVASLAGVLRSLDRQHAESAGRAARLVYEARYEPSWYRAEIARAVTAVLG